MVLKGAGGGVIRARCDGHARRSIHAICVFTPYTVSFPFPVVAPPAPPPATPTRDLFTGVAAVLSVLLARRAANPLRTASALPLAPCHPLDTDILLSTSFPPFTFSSPHLPKLVPNLCVLV